MKTIHSFLLILLFLIGISCSEEDPDTDKNDSLGKAVFFTNAQALLNCGSFDVDIYIDSVKAGSINTACLSSNQETCNQSDSTLVIEKEEGSYSYVAKANCGNYGSWEGVVTIQPGTCEKIFLDIQEINETEFDIKTKLLGTWLEIAPCDSCNTLVIQENDIILQKSNLDNSILSSSYQVISDDSILVSRNWQIEEEKKTTRNKFIFHSDDTLEIKQFLPVDAGVTGFDDIMLKK